MKFIKNYKSSLLLIIATLVGGCIGLLMGSKAAFFAPFGDIFLNLIFTLLIPLVFFSISSAIANITSSRKLGRILIISIIVFALTAIIAGIIGVISFRIFNPASGLSMDLFKGLTSDTTAQSTNILQKLVSSLTVGDFSLLLSRSNLLALIIFSILVGLGTMTAKDEGASFKAFLNSSSAVCMKIMNIIMFYAPIGIGAYFANMVGQLGSQILEGYLKVFILYLIISIIYFIAFFTLYAFIGSGKNGIKLFWKNATAPSVTALATCSSAACIHVNIEASKAMGVSDTLAKLLLPLGTNIHKDGSVIGGIYKIMFLFVLFEKDITMPSSLLIILGSGLLIGALVGAIPGGGAIGEMLILSLFGFPAEALAIMMVIATVIDAPATLLNSAGNTVCTMMISRFTEKRT
ncbi:dicarboxylate/amino acid:cation symporter [Clostridium culturomicium]|uniref:dicarboxylate/amino acid:cation symporter n=1 Tax=Clostridium culturomicium TaxID=1499683 RepID=UPI00058B20A2|nr:cation:dicarboxylase symporter family transporter [Clostridium culturomicium]